MDPWFSNSEKGFTLIEVIVTMVVAAVLFTMMFTYFSRSFMDSALPVVRLQQSMALTRVAERITAHYSQDRSQATLIKISDNLRDTPNTSYGNGFKVLTNAFITFSGRNDAPESGNKEILKITIQSSQTNETITLLLRQW